MRSPSYENFLLIGDFNCQIQEESVSNFFKQQVGFRQGVNAQHRLLVMIEKSRKVMRVGTMLRYLQICQKHLNAVK